MSCMSEEGRNPMVDEVRAKGSLDILYHLGLDTGMDISAFKDVRYVVMGGSPVRAEAFAEDLRQRFAPDLPSPLKPSGKTERFSLFKVGPIISVSHGVGMPSMLIVLHEVAKLLFYAGAKDVAFMRVGTSGGIGSEPGTIIVSTRGMMGTLEAAYETIELGERRRWNTELDAGLSAGLLKAASACGIAAVSGATIGTDDFYEGQGRLDGALRPGYTEEQKMAFLRRAHEAGARNIEMEAPAFAAFCHRAGIRGSIICCSIVNRLKGDQIESTPAQLGQFSVDAQRVVAQFIATDLAGGSEPPAKKAKEGPENQ